MRRLQSRILGSTSFAVLALAALASPAAAQTAPQGDATQNCDSVPDSERAACEGRLSTPGQTATDNTNVVVTGSRISRPNYDTDAPAVILDSTTIENRGFETLGQALNEQPSFGVPGASPVGAAQGGSFGSGQSFVNFLGLGDQRTLVLVNGHRFVSSNTASIFGPSNAGTQVDLNGINTRLVDRVETIAIGGAPIYGSDAIAGTVNIILRHDYQGFEIDGQYGIAEEGDAPNYRIRAIGGMNFAGGRGNITLSGEYNRGRGLVYNDREATRRGRFYGDCPAGSQFSQCLYNDRRLPSISESGVLLVGDFVPISDAQGPAFGLPPGFNLGVQDAQGNQLAFDAAGNLIPIDFGGQVGPDGSFNTDFSGGNGFNLFNTSNLLTDTERYNATALFSYELTDNIRFHGEAWYSHSKGVNLRAQPVYNSALFDAGGTPDGNIIISVNNPFLTAAQRQIILNSIANNPLSDQNQGGGPQDYFYLGRANTDLASGRASSTTDVYRFVAGLEGSFHAGWREFHWDLTGNYGRAKGQGREPVLVQQNFENAVNAVAGPGGTIVCAPGAVNSPMPTISSTCAPINLFGNNVSRAAADYVTAIADPSSRNSQVDFVASISGPLMHLPGGDLKIALGYEHRREATSFDPGAFYFGGADPDPATDADGDGDPTNDRVQFGRSVPILPVSGHYNTDEAFGELTAELVSPNNDIPAIYRLELHGAARYVDHSTAGSDWTWTVEGRWSPIRDIAFRANYTRAIRAPAITEIFNPSSSLFTFATDPCETSNLGNGPDPATRRANCAAAGVPAVFNALSDQRSFRGALAGNVDLQNERSNAWSVGVVLTPRFIPNLRLSADYLDIKLRDAISNLSATQVVASCYDSTSFPANQFCDRVTRDAAHQIDFVETSFFNASQLRYKGILAALDYRVATPFLGTGSHLSFNLSYQYLDTLTNQSTAGSAPATLDGTIGYPHNSAVLNISYENGPYLLFTSFNYTGPVDQAANEAPNFREFERIDSVTYVNVGMAINVNDRMRLRFTVDNVLGTGVPFPVPAFGGAVTYFPGVLGRYFRAGASVSF